MSNTIQSDSQTFAVAGLNDIQKVLTDCSNRKQPVITLTTEILMSHDWRSVNTACRLDLSRISAIKIDAARKLAIVGPGTRLSSVVAEAQNLGMMPEIDTVACIDFTFSDWSHETLRMLPSGTSGIDAALRNVKVAAPSQTFQTGYDSFPANGGGYDLTKMFMSSGMSLGVPYEFAIPLRPIPEIMSKRTYSFQKTGDAVGAGVKMHRSGFPRSVKMRSAGFEDLLVSGKESSASGTQLIVRLEGNKAILDAAEKAMDDIAGKSGGKVIASEPDAPRFINPASINPSAWMIGICLCDTNGLESVISDLSAKAADAKKSFQYCVADLTPNVSVIAPVLHGPPVPEVLGSIGSYLISNRISLRGNPAFNPTLGDSRAISRIEVLRQIKRFLDPKMVLNPHVLEVF